MRSSKMCSHRIVQTSFFRNPESAQSRQNPARMGFSTLPTARQNAGRSVAEMLGLWFRSLNHSTPMQGFDESSTSRRFIANEMTVRTSCSTAFAAVTPLGSRLAWNVLSSARVISTSDRFSNFPRYSRWFFSQRRIVIADAPFRANDAMYSAYAPPKVSFATDASLAFVYGIYPIARGHRQLGRHLAGGG